MTALITWDSNFTTGTSIQIVDHFCKRGGKKLLIYCTLKIHVKMFRHIAQNTNKALLNVHSILKAGSNTVFMAMVAIIASHILNLYPKWPNHLHHKDKRKESVYTEGTLLTKTKTKWYDIKS
jgi:hypothetical protein